MLRAIALASLFLSLAGVAQAQALAPPVQMLPDPGGSDRPAREGAAKPPAALLFISPSGEPFRGADGMGAWLSGADADHDGALSIGEFRADALRFFAVLDPNHDGVLDAFEIQAYERERAPEIAVNILEEGRPGGLRFGRRRAAAPHAGREGAARYSLINEPQPVAAADEDIDGKVTPAEWTRAASRRFALLDKNKTGRLTRESLLGKAPPTPKS